MNLFVCLLYDDTNTSELMTDYDCSDNGIYVWRDTRRGGCSIGDDDIEELVSFAKIKKIKRILYDNWGTGKTRGQPSWDIGSCRQPDEFLSKLISSAHDSNILVEVLYTDNLRCGDVTSYHAKNPANKFDAFRINYEGPWNLGGPTFKKAYEPVSSGDIEYFASVKKKMCDVSKPDKIPQWIKKNARWWADGMINDAKFVSGIQYLIKEGIVKISSPSGGVSVDTAEIPAWIKNNAKWWADGTINDDSFVTSIQWLIKNGIVVIDSDYTDDATTLPVYASISWHWGSRLGSNPDSPIEHNGIKKQTFEHILDILDGVDIQPGVGAKLLKPKNDIVERTSPIIKYARKNSKKVWITIETGQFEDKSIPTFAPYGITKIEQMMEDVISMFKAKNDLPSGIIYHFYKNTYGK